MLKRIHNNVTFQPRMIDDLDEALKKLNFWENYTPIIE